MRGWHEDIIMSYCHKTQLAVYSPRDERRKLVPPDFPREVICDRLVSIYILSSVEKRRSNFESPDKEITDEILRYCNPKSHPDT